jgi:hypothetical protein
MIGHSDQEHIAEGDCLGHCAGLGERTESDEQVIELVGMARRE